MVALNSCAFPSLDFPNRTVVTAREIAARLCVTTQHVQNLIEAGVLDEEQARFGTKSRKMAKVPIASYRAFIGQRMSRAVDFDPPPPLKYASLDFTSAAAVTCIDVATKLGCSDAHVVNLIADGELCALDMRGPNSKRGTWRVPIEAYRHFMNLRMGRTLPATR